MARQNGSFFEYCVYSSLGGQPYDVYTLQKFDGSLLGQPVIFNMDKVVQTRVVKHVRLLGDNHGRNGVTSDMMVYFDDGTVCGVSCKRNNMSIKHPCPRGIVRFLDGFKKLSFIRLYNQLNIKWYNRIRQYEVFRCVPAKTKQQMLNEVSKLVASYINEEYIRFLLSYNTARKDYIVQYNKRGPLCPSHDLCVYSMRDVSFNNIQIKHNKHWIYIVVDGVEISMRLHTASSRIKQTIKLKFDTKIKDKFSLYNEM